MRTQEGTLLVKGDASREDRQPARVSLLMGWS